MKVAVVHYWLFHERGGEKVLQAILELFPQADIYTLFYDKNFTDKVFPNHKIKVSFLNNIPYSKRFYQHLLPLMPFALEQFDLNQYDLIISSESGPAKGILPGVHSKHICYCHSPMRYIWDMRKYYYNNMNIINKPLFYTLSHYLRMWDISTNHRVDAFIANSSFVKRRIKRYYGLDSEVIHPPVDLKQFSPGHQDNSGTYYLSISQLVPYKNLQLAIKAFNELGLTYIVAGTGPEYKNLKKISKKNIIFLGRIKNEDLLKLYRGSKAFIFPGVEDFGITPLESIACHKPVIALKAGGVLDTLNEKVAIFFNESIPDSLSIAVDMIESGKKIFKKTDFNQQINKFSKKKFQKKIKAKIEEICQQ